MPRQARVDAPGALHHIIVREMERCKLFKDDADLDKTYSTELSRKLNILKKNN